MKKEREKKERKQKTIEMCKQKKETEGKSDGLCFIGLLIISLVNILLYLDALLILFIWDSCQ